VALSDEQNAMLRLLASGEQGYADIAALLGLSEDEVRAKVVGALAQLQAEGKPAPDVPPPLAGGAQPAAEVAPPEPEPVAEAPATAEEPAIADAVVPPAAPKQAATRPASPPPQPPPADGRTITLPSGRGAWLLGGGVLAVIAAIVVVILVASGGGGGDSSSTTAAEAPSGTATEEGAAKGAAEETGTGEGAAKAPTEAELTAVDGGKAAGRAAFGRIKNKLALQVEATGLEPTTQGTNSYWIWLAQSPQKMLPLASAEVKASGKGAGSIAAEYEVPVEVLGYLASGTFDQLTITLADNARIKASVEAAKKEKSTPAYTGKAVLSGTITGPIVGLATREEEEKEAE
jgi:hypothetical protein